MTFSSKSAECAVECATLWELFFELWSSAWQEIDFHQRERKKKSRFTKEKKLKGEGREKGGREGQAEMDDSDLLVM